MFDDDKGFFRLFRSFGIIAVVVWLSIIALNVAIFGFIGWVAIKLLQHYGII